MENNNDFYKDMLKDAKHQRLVSTVVILILSLIIVGLVVGIFMVSIHCQNLLRDMAIESDNKIIQMLNDTEFTTEYQIKTDSQSFNNGNITVNK